MFNLEGHTALITGGNGGIGLSFAKGLVKSGAEVAIWGRNADKNAAAEEIIMALGGKVHSEICDVTDPDQVNQAFASTIEATGKIDSCFANAGGAGNRGLVHQMDLDAWKAVLDMNVNSVVHTFQPMINHLLQRQAPGKLIVTSSIAAMMGTPFQSSYATTKAAVVGLTRSLAVELGKMGITANALLPGYVESDLTRDTPQEFKDGAMRRACLGRVGRQEDMEGVAVFMASPHSDYMTGHALVMDGGHTIFPI